MLLLCAFSPKYEAESHLWDKFYGKAALHGKIVCDVMMGGGTTIVEALRLGCSVIGIDVNPVAWFVTKKELDSLDTKTSEMYLKRIEKEVLSLQRFYQTRCLKGHSASIVYAIWVHKISCAKCQKETRLFRDQVILDIKSKKSKRRNLVLICPTCLHVWKAKKKVPRVACPECRHVFTISSKLVKLAVFRCPHCHNKEKLANASKRYGGPLPEEMCCIQFYCSKCGQGFKSPTSGDLARFAFAQREWRRLRKSLPYPKQRIITKGRFCSRPVNRGYSHYWQLFNERQLLVLSSILSSIRKIPEENIREFFLLVFSNCLETNNRLCKYESKWKKISSLFGVPGFHVPERYGEGNVWGAKFGRGNFLTCYRKLIRAKMYLDRPYELKHIPKKPEPKKILAGNAVTALSVESFHDLSKGGNALLLCQSSENLHDILDRCVDVIMTDPPYFDNFVYSELADFFFVWQRILLKSRYKWFKPQSSASTREIVVNTNSRSSESQFTSRLTRVFRECRRILKDDGLLVFTFHHSKPEAWKCIRASVEHAGFVVTAAPVLRSEGRTGYRKRGSISHDACVVCRKQTGSTVDKTKLRVLKTTSEIISDLEKLNGGLSESDILTVLMGQCLMLGSRDYSEIMQNPDQLVKSLSH